MKTHHFSLLVLFLSLVLSSCGQDPREFLPHAQMPPTEISPTPVPVQSSPEKQTSTLRIVGTEIGIGGLFYIEKTMSAFPDHGIKLLSFDTRTQAMELEYGDAFGVRGDEICTSPSGKKSTIKFIIPTREEFESGTKEACIMKNVCGPSWSFCFVRSTNASSTSIDVIEMHASDGDNPME